MKGLPCHYESSATVAGTAAEVFAVADEPDLMMRHMSRPSLMMGGGALRCDIDALGGKAPGSVISFKGKAFGLSIEATEIIEERVPPSRKSWTTIGSPRLVVISDYRMGFEVAPVPAGSALRVWIDYALPRAGWTRFAGLLMGSMFARWCVENMLREVERVQEGQTR